jgi:hypothetical protein
LEYIWSIIKVNNDEKERNRKGPDGGRQYAAGWHYDLYEARQNDCTVFELHGEAQ